MDQQRDALRSLFDAVAGSYDQVGVDFFQPIADGLVALLDPQPGERALDLGCGRGAVLLPIGRAVGPSGAAVGGDLAPAMVSQAAALAQAEGLGQVEVRVVDADDPDLGTAAEGGFDLVSSSLVLFFLPDAGGALARWRVLARPGGRVGVSTFGDPDPTWHRIDALFQPYLPPQLRDARSTGAAGPFESDAGVEDLLRSAGWVDVRTATTTVPVHFDDAEHWYRFTMSTGQRGFWGMVHEPERPRVRADAERILREVAGPDGSVTFAQQVRYTLGRNP